MAMRRGPKRASKVQEKKLIQNAKDLAKDPLQVIPECEGSCLMCKYGRAEKKIKKISKYSDDEKRLKKYAKRGPDLAKAVAGTLLLAQQEEAPLLGRARTPQGEISFAKRGKASKERLIGVQHFDDPKLRLLTFANEAKKGYYFYSVGDHVVCTGKEDDPPKEYVKSAVNSAPYTFESGEEKNEFSCGHTSKDMERSYFTLRWKSIDRKFSVCYDCSKSDVNLFTTLSERMISKDISNSFSLDGTYNLECRADCKSCSLNSDISIPSELKDEYFEGLPDRSLLAKYKKKARSVLDSRGDIFVMGDGCYGKKKASFLNDLRYEDWEEPIIRGVLKKTSGLVLDEGTVNEFLEKKWSDHGEKILKAMIDDDERIKDLTEQVKAGDVRPREALREAHQEKKKRKKLSNIPEFKKLPRKANFAHKVGKIYKTKGQKEATKYIEDLNISDTKMKALAYAFLASFGEGEKKRWKYGDEEVESGEFLKQYVDNFLSSDGMDYAEKLQQLIKASGSTGTIVLKNGKKMR